MTSVKTIGRLSLYRRLLSGLLTTGAMNIYSHQLAAMAGGTAAQVRRDLMSIGYNGSPKRGYDVRELADSIGAFLDAPHGQGVALVGVGNLGRAILSFFSGRRPKLSIVAAFDADPNKYNRVILGCRCYPLAELPEVTASMNIKVGIITVPASAAQDIADQMVWVGIRGILNFAPVPLRVPQGVYVEDIDMTMSIEKVAYFARLNVIDEREVASEHRD